MTENFVKYTFGIVSIIGIFLMPIVADASTISPVSGNGINITVTFSGNSQSAAGQTGSDNQVSFFNAGTNAFIGYTTSAGSYTIPTQTAGTIVDAVFYDNTETEHGAYCGDNGTVTGSTNLTNCLSAANSPGYDESDPGMSWTISYLFPLPYVPPGLVFFSSTTDQNSETELSNSVTSTISSVWPIAMVAVAIPLSFYIAESVIQIFRLRDGKKVKGKITRLTAAVDRRRQKSIRKMWKDDAENS